MLRWLLILVLAVAVGVGVVGQDDGCADDDCGLEAGAEGGGDDCPPLCGGCARVASLVMSSELRLASPQQADRVVETTPTAPITSPPGTGLFRPPRA